MRPVIILFLSGIIGIYLKMSYKRAKRLFELVFRETSGHSF